MNFLTNFFAKLFGKKPSYEVTIKFHKEAVYYGEHGTMVVNNIKLGMKDATIRFVFVGLETPPVLDQRIFNLLWEEAKAAGFMPVHIRTYGKYDSVIGLAKPLQGAMNIPVTSL